MHPRTQARSTTSTFSTCVSCVAAAAIVQPLYHHGASFPSFLPSLQGKSVLPAAYREVRTLSMRVDVHPPAEPPSLLGALPSLPGMQAGGDESKADDADHQRHSFTFPVSVHEAYHAGPVVMSHDVRDMGVTVTLKVSLRGRRQAELVLHDASGAEHKQRREIVGDVIAADDGGVAFQAVGFLVAPLEVTANVMVAGKLRRATISSGACQLV